MQIERRRLLVAEMYLKGTGQAQIAAELSVSQGTISADLKAIRKEWRDSRIRDFDEAVSFELKKLDHLEREAWGGWERSQQPAETTRVTSDGGDKRAEKTVRNQPGDPRYLEQVQRSIAGRRALLGLDSPVKIAPTSPDGEQTYHAQAMSELMRLAEKSQGGPVVIDAEFIQQEVQRCLENSPGAGDTSVNENDPED